MDHSSGQILVKRITFIFVGNIPDHSCDACLRKDERKMNFYKQRTSIYFIKGEMKK